MPDGIVDRTKLRIRGLLHIRHRVTKGKGGVTSIAARSASSKPPEGATRPMTTVIGLRAKNHPARFSFLGTAVERKLADALSGAGLALDPIPPKLASRFIRDDRLALQEDTIAVKGDRLTYRPRRSAVATAGVVRNGRYYNTMSGETPESHAE
jgi:hypothetical protein